MYNFISEIFIQNINLFYIINGGIESNLLDFLMPLITNLGSIVAWVAVCVLLYIFGGEKGRKVAILGLTALFISNIIVYLLKLIIAEPRPFLALPNVEVLASANGYSFPSGHTASSFAAAVVIGLKYKLRFHRKTYSLIYPLLTFAGVIGFSRIYIGVHYPLDVVFGAIIGILSAILTLKIGNKILADKLSQECRLNNPPVLINQDKENNKQHENFKMMLFNFLKI